MTILLGDNIQDPDPVGGHRKPFQPPTGHVPGPIGKVSGRSGTNYSGIACFTSGLTVWHPVCLGNYPHTATIQELCVNGGYRMITSMGRYS